MSSFFMPGKKALFRATDDAIIFVLFLVTLSALRNCLNAKNYLLHHGNKAAISSAGHSNYLSSNMLPVKCW